MELQQAQAVTAGLIDRRYAEELASYEKSVGWAVVDGDTTLACGGIIEAWPGRALSWALFSDEALRRFRHVHRLVLGVLRDAPWRRIEMDVDAAHTAGIRWAERLGFVAEGVRRKYTTDGRDVVLYARVK
ncbi:GNAT family N-acetyltransferase [Chitinasiproducens palmae]|uniref:GNAT family acetyltransferase n=1 Tax=Chitinasiproducens palmae TaxID=1770053 RepID=UPI001F3BFA83|nr:GNAT family acetyltransferase [Chitinasiproducens palmae]